MTTLEKFKNRIEGKAPIAFLPAIGKSALTHELQIAGLALGHDHKNSKEFVEEVPNLSHDSLHICNLPFNMILRINSQNVSIKEPGSAYRSPGPFTATFLTDFFGVNFK